MKVDNLKLKNLEKTFRRLKKSTKRFSKLIVRDAIDYIDFEVDLANNLKYLIYQIQSNSYIPSKPYLHNTAKSKGINRPTVVLDILDMIVYRFCIEQIENELLGKTRQKNIRGGIKITANLSAKSADDFYEKWFNDWNEHQQNLKQSLNRKRILVSTDIASYFENINLLILKDSVRSDVNGKTNLLNLLFYFLEHTKRRYDYEVNTFIGLLQEDIDASRLLAYYFLRLHDEVMAEFCANNNAEYYRFVDDMSITVNNETDARKALKALTESLRRLNLVAGIEKTEIIPADRAKKEMFFSENEQLTILQNALINRLSIKADIKPVEKLIRSYYRKIKKVGCKRKNWIKILKRFYTLSSYGGFDLFSKEIENQIIEYPLLFSDGRILKYTIRQSTNVLNKIVNFFVDYLYSPEKLYPQLESNLLEVFLAIPVKQFDKSTIIKLKKLAKDCFFKKNDYKALSEYARALAALLIYKFNDQKSIDDVCKYYLNNKINDSILQKYIVLVSLYSNKHNLRNSVLAKAKKELNPSLQRLVNMIENADAMLRKRVVKDYVSKKELIILFKDDTKFKIFEEYDHVRGRLLKEILNIYA